MWLFQLSMVQTMIFAAEAASLAKAVTSWGATLISDLPWLAGATAALQLARAAVSKFHDGGTMGYDGQRIPLKSDERPAILRVGETVIPEGKSSGGNTLHVHFHGPVSNEEGMLNILKRGLEKSGFTSLNALITNDRKGYSFGTATA